MLQTIYQSKGNYAFHLWSDRGLNYKTMENLTKAWDHNSFTLISEL